MEKERNRSSESSAAPPPPVRPSTPEDLRLAMETSDRLIDAALESPAKLKRELAKLFRTPERGSASLDIPPWRLPQLPKTGRAASER